MIQFPQGPGQPAFPEPIQNVTSPNRPVDSPTHSLQPPTDSIALQKAAVASLELELLAHWDNAAARAAGTAEYQLARASAATGDHSATLQHLEQAILAQPLYAQTAQQDTAFDQVKGSVREMVGRLTVVARIRAEVSIADAVGLLESGRLPDGPGRVHAQTYLDLAQAHLESASYAGYLLAAQAAAFAQQTPAPDASKLPPLPPRTATRSKSLWRPVARALCQSVRSLWQALPLLAILLGWLLAGIVAGFASLPFQQGAVAQLRQTLFPIWALGLLTMVLLGFIRSISRISRR